jgi:predicted nuclease of restriction endonuclease-like (RecB) superfamily
MRIEKEAVRNFYIEECIAAHWSTRQLVQIKGDRYIFEKL